MVQSRVWTRYADFYRSSPYSIFPQEHRQTPGRLPFQMITVDQADHDFIDPSVPETILAVPLSVAEGSSWSWNMGDGWHHDIALPGRMIVSPADNISRWEVRGARKLLFIAIPSSTVRRILGPTGPDKPSEAFLPLAEQTWEDPFLSVLMLRLWRATEGAQVADRLLVDGALTTLVSHLLQRAGAEDQSLKYVSLPPWRLNRVYDFVNAHLHEEIDMSTLAEVAGLSVRHFSRAFRDEVGETPHRWIMQQRTERAIHMLSKGNMHLAQIADVCGFAGQSHFTRVFKQVTGYTPKRWFHSKKAA